MMYTAISFDVLFVRALVFIERLLVFIERLLVFIERLLMFNVRLCGNQLYMPNCIVAGATVQWHWRLLEHTWILIRQLLNNLINSNIKYQCSRL